MHPIEQDEQAQERFQRIQQADGRRGQAVAAWRTAAEACTGSLPTWAQRRTPGRKKKLPYAATRLGGPADSFHAVASGDTSQ